MNALTENAAAPAKIGARTYRCTMGYYNQSGSWTDVRTFTWPELATLLTRHAVGDKEGTCIVPALFTGVRRHNADARQIDVVLLDCDAGTTLQEIVDAIRMHGWAAAISSTYSHLTTITRARRDAWARFRDAAADQATAASDFLVAEKGYLPRVAAGARIHSEDAQYVTFVHQPCPKFRIALPLSRPWRAADYDNQEQANAAWAERIEALAAALRLSHDPSCTDTARLFYLPRRPANGPLPETAMLEGLPCDIFALPGAPDGRAARTKPGRLGGKAGTTPGSFVDSETGEVVDLQAWAAEMADRFEIVRALRARRPDIFVGRVSKGIKHHIRCANEDAHTNAGADVATMVIDASQSANRGFVYHCRHAHCDGSDRLVFLRRMLERGWLKVADLTDPQFLVGDAPAPIRFVAGNLPQVVDQAEQALLRVRADIYQRGPFLVRPGRVMVTVADERTVIAQSILVVEEHALVDVMTQAASWERFDGRSKKWVAIDAPMKVAATYRQRIGHWLLPVLAGLINAPTLRADGSVLAAEGYDSATGLLLNMDRVEFPTIPDQPSKDDAAAALRVLNELIATFPFVDGSSRSVMLSGILTASIRRSLPTAPMHAFSAPTAGSGKSMLVDLISLIASGREVGVISQGKTEEELEKRLGALLLAGDHVIGIDNCEAPLGGEFLCSMLTQQRVRARILGASKAPELPTNAFVTATGNNLVLVGDLTRRAVMSRLDPEHERPELLQFKTKPTDLVRAGRGRYLVAALTILRAYHAAGRPKQADPLGSFEDWSNWVRGALLWLGCADPVDTIEGSRDMDPKLDALTAVVTQWHTVIGEGTVTARDVITRATEQHIVVSQGSPGFPKSEYAYPDFREALLAVAGEGGTINSKRLGKWLSGNQDRILQDFRLVRGGYSAGIMRWRLERVSMTKGGEKP